MAHGHPTGLASVHALRTQKRGSIEDFELLLSRRLRDRGEGHLLILQTRPPAWLERLFADAGATVEAIDFEAEGLQGVRRLSELCAAHGVRVLIFSFFGLHQPAWLAAMVRCRQRLVFWEHASGRKRRPSWFVAIHGLERILYAMRGVRMIGVSEFVRRRLIDDENVPAARVEKIYNGVDLDRFAPGPLDEELLSEAGFLTDEARTPESSGSGTTERIVVSTIAHLRREKGVHDLIEAIALLCPRFPGIRLLVAGDGPERPQLERLARERGISTRVRFLGVRSDVDRVLRASDVAVFPSTWEEAFGLVLVEAMGCAKAVVSTRVGAIPEIVADGVTGFLVAPGDPAALAARINFLCQDRALRARMGEAARRAALERFRLDRTVDDVLALYDDLSQQARWAAVAVPAS